MQRSRGTHIAGWILAACMSWPLAAAAEHGVDENVIYAFAPDRIVVIDPETGAVVKEITEGVDDVEWSNPVVSRNNHFVFANDTTNAEVVVIDTATQSILRWIPVGPRPVHMYSPGDGSEIWTHSDAEGAFYIIDVASLDVTGRVVTAGVGHGKLLYADELGSKAYATNVTVPEVFEIDLERREVVQRINVCGEGGGTHGKAYSAVSDHAYFECFNGSVAVLDTTTDALVTNLRGGRGQIFASPGGAFLLVSDKDNNKIHVIDARRDDIFLASIDVTGGPDKIFFHRRDDDGSVLAFTANTLSPTTTVIDLATLSVAAQVAAGDIDRPAGAERFHREGMVAAGTFITPASGDGVVAIVDAEEVVLRALVPAAAGVDAVAFVGPRS